MPLNSEVTLKERNLAIVLLDIIGSTDFVQRNGAQTAARWFQFHDRLTRNICYKFSGREIDRSDGFLLSFDRLIDAVNFALIYQQTVPSKTKLQCRIGVHWGRVIEVTQDELWVEAGAKRVELEGLAKNVAARTMSLCQAGQVLLTKDAMQRIRGRTNAFTPKGTRYVCVGLYKFKGVKDPQQIYAVGDTIKSLQPPKGSEKVKRLGGPRYIKSRARDRKFLEWVSWFYYRLGFVASVFWFYLFYRVISNGMWRVTFGLESYFFWVDGLNDFFMYVWEIIKGIIQL